MVRVLFGLFLVAHGLIHTGFVTRAPAASPGAPEWPFAMGRSWLISGAGIDEAVIRALGTALVLVTLVAFVGAGLAWFGFLVPAEWWPAFVIVGSIASIGLLLAFFHPWLILGLAIDLVLLYLVIGSGWTAEASAAP